MFKMGILEEIERGFLSDIEYHMMLDNVNWMRFLIVVEEITPSGMQIIAFSPFMDEDLVDKTLKH